MKYLLIAAAVTLAAAGSSQAMEAANFSANEDENSPRVQAFYSKQCKQWSSANWIRPDQREAFEAQCVKDLAQAWPVGMDHSADE